MNILKILRKPYFATFFASLMLFISCNVDSHQIENLDEEKLKVVVKNHISISEKIAFKFRNKKDIKLDVLSKSPNYFNNINELEEILIDVGIKEKENKELAKLFYELQTNITNFLKSINAKSIYTKEEVIKIITDEIDKQMNFTVDNNLSLTKSGCRSQCYDRYFVANKRCERNWYIGVAALTVSGFFTLGTGTIVGAAVVGGQLLLCGNDAQNDRDDCLRNCDSQTQNQ